MKELLNKLGITQAGYFSKDKSYIIDFDDDKEYNKGFSRIDKSNLLCIYSNIFINDSRYL